MERLPAERHRSRYLLPFAVDRELHGAAVLLVHRKGAVGIVSEDTIEIFTTVIVDDTYIIGVVVLLFAVGDHPYLCALGRTDISRHLSEYFLCRYKDILMVKVHNKIDLVFIIIYFTFEEETVLSVTDDTGNQKNEYK
jgi:hypothetical protein